MSPALPQETPGTFREACKQALTHLLCTFLQLPLLSDFKGNKKKKKDHTSYIQQLLNLNKHRPLIDAIFIITSCVDWAATLELWVHTHSGNKCASVTDRGSVGPVWLSQAGEKWRGRKRSLVSFLDSKPARHFFSYLPVKCSQFSHSVFFLITATWELKWISLVCRRT